MSMTPKTAQEVNAEADVLAPSPPELRTAAERVLDGILVPVDRAMVPLSSGRIVELEAGERSDRVVVRARGGEIVLRIEVSDAGPILSFAAAELELVATGKVAIRGRSVEVSAEEELALNAGGDRSDRVGGTRHARIGGEDRLEAGEIAMQASDGALRAKACEGIHLDGERIGLNDDPLPTPFPWSRIATEDSDGRE
jgi:hypothetical protein